MMPINTNQFRPQPYVTSNSVDNSKESGDKETKLDQAKDGEVAKNKRRVADSRGREIVQQGITGGSNKRGKVQQGATLVVGNNRYNELLAEGNMAEEFATCDKFGYPLDQHEGLRLDIETCSSDAFAQRSLKDRMPIAFIVNTILSHQDVSKIQETINAMLKGISDEKQDRIAIVLGVNAHQRDVDSLEMAITDARIAINNVNCPIAIVASKYGSDKFPYGKMRTQVLHSDATRNLTRCFAKLGSHPYISIQDFDDGSRCVGNNEGKHVFVALEERLNPSDQEDEATSTRPLMFGGGYRPQTEASLLARLEPRLSNLSDKEKRKLDENMVKSKHYDLKEYSKSQISELLLQVQTDMKRRDISAKMHPMLAYVPEPNLYLDAISVYKSHLQSNTHDSKIEFGEKGAEYFNLRKLLTSYFHYELNNYFSRREFERESIPQLMREESKEDDTQRMIIHSQNNTHPTRELAFDVSFEEFTIETDLSRIFKNKLVSGQNSQGHGVGSMLDAALAGKNNKKDVAPARVNSEFSGEGVEKIGKFANIVKALIKKNGNISLDLMAFFEKHADALGTRPKNVLSPALQGTIKDGPFKGTTLGLKNENKRHFFQQMAFHRDFKDNYNEIMAFLKNDFSKPDLFDDVKQFTSPTPFANGVNNDENNRELLEALQLFEPDEFEPTVFDESGPTELDEQTLDALKSFLDLP